MSDVTSTGSHGKTCRQDVLRRVDIPVVQGAADPVPDQAHASEGAVEQCCLFGRWVRPAFVRRPYAMILAARFVAADSGPFGSGVPCPVTMGDPIPHPPEGGGLPGGSR